MVCDHRELHVLNHSVPTRRSSDLSASVSPLALVMVWYSCGGIRLPALPGPACMPPAARKRKRSPSRSSSSYWVISSSPSQTPSTHHRPQWSWIGVRSEEHTSELQSLMRISYAVFCLKKKKKTKTISTK